MGSSNRSERTHCGWWKTSRPAFVRFYDEPERLVQIARRTHANMLLPDRGPWLPWDDDDAHVPGINPKTLDGIVLDDTDAERIGT